MADAIEAAIRKNAGLVADAMMAGPDPATEQDDAGEGL